MRGAGLRLLILAALVAAVLGACGSTPPSPPGPSPVGVCGLVPDMDALVGMTSVDRPAGFTLNGVDRCVWTYETDPSRSVGVSLAPLVAHDAAIASLGESEAVVGIGEDGRWWAANGLLSVKVDGVVLQVDLQLDDVHTTKDLAIRVAQTAAANFE